MPALLGSLRHEDTDFLRSLPLFPMLAGGRVPLQASAATPYAQQQGCAGACSWEDTEAVFGSLAAVPFELKVRLWQWGVCHQL